MAPFSCSVLLARRKESRRHPQLASVGRNRVEGKTSDNENKGSSVSGRLRTRRKPTREYEMAIFLENLEEHTIPVIESRAKYQLPSFESVLSYCSTETKSHVSAENTEIKEIGRMNSYEDSAQVVSPVVDEIGLQLPAEEESCCETLANSTGKAMEIRLDNVRILQKIQCDNWKAKNRRRGRAGKQPLHYHGKAIEQYGVIDRERIQAAKERTRRKNKGAKERRRSRKKRYMSRNETPGSPKNISNESSS